MERNEGFETLILKKSMKISKRENVLEANRVCLATGEAVALNLMFEDKYDHRLFLELWDKYLGAMTEVLNYYLSPTGWTVLFKTKSAVEIRESYRLQRAKSKKAKPERTKEEVSGILSEHFRIFLSQYVRRFNARKGRSGTLVFERFRKYVFKSHANYQKIFDLLTSKHRSKRQKLQKYQADERGYDIKKEITENDPLIVGVPIRLEGSVDGDRWNGRFGVLGCFGGWGAESSVLRKFFETIKSKKMHPPDP